VPPIVGGRTSLNLFAALVGPSGYGKGGSESAGRDAIEFVGATVPQPLLELNPGSGEGLAKTFQVTGDENAVHTALFTAPEVDTLSALMGHARHLRVSCARFSPENPSDSLTRRSTRELTCRGCRIVPALSSGSSRVGLVRY